MGEPYTAWIIALVIATIYGWVMHRRGFNQGDREATNLILAALSDANIIKPKRAVEIVVKFCENATGQDEEE